MGVPGVNSSLRIITLCSTLICHSPQHLLQPFLCLYQSYNPAASPLPSNKSPWTQCQRLKYHLYFPSESGLVARTATSVNFEATPGKGSLSVSGPSIQASGSLHVQKSVFKKTAIKICLHRGSHRGQCNKSTPKILISPRGSCQTCTTAVLLI